jgi:hypothetical protein
LPIILKDARDRANKELAHLTLKRKAGEPPDKVWNFVAISFAIGPVTKDFLSRVDAQNLPEEVRVIFRKMDAVPGTYVTAGSVFNSSSFE